MNNTFNILQHHFYINENNNELYITTESINIKFYDYLKNIIIEKNLSEIEEYIKDMKPQIDELLPQFAKKAFYVINELTIF